MSYTHLFFDLDRTLWDYDANASGSLTTIYSEFGLDQKFQNPEEFITIYNHHNDLLWEQYRQGAVGKLELREKRFRLTLMEKGIDDSKLALNMDALYMEITPRSNILYPHTIETLEYLKEKQYHMFILTNGFLSTQQVKMASSNLEHFFERIFSSEEAGRNKPHRDIFHWAVSSVNAKKKHCLMIGDDLEVDIRGAMNYGIDTIWFNPSGQKVNVEPTHTISTLSELRVIL